MPADARPQRRRYPFPYTGRFQSLSTSDREEELALLKKVYEQDQLTIRQIASILDASYGFIQQRLTDASATIDITRRKRPPVSAEATATIASLPTRRALS